MLTMEDYIRLSLEKNLFWLRIMKEHAIFIESSLPPTERRTAIQADRFKQVFENLLLLTIRLANGLVSRDALHSMQYYTRYTDESERIWQKFTGVDINRNLTLLTTNIEPINPSSVFSARREQEISILNQNILTNLKAFVLFKNELYINQASCSAFSFEYTSVLEHILREGRQYINVLTSLQNRELPYEDVPPNDETFWNHIMGDHAKVIRGKLDPSEEALFHEADQFAMIYEALMEGSTVPSFGPEPLNSLSATVEFSEYKSEVTKGIIECKVEIVTLSLFVDHLLREANHYIYLLTSRS